MRLYGKMTAILCMLTAATVACAQGSVTAQSAPVTPEIGTEAPAETHPDARDIQFYKDHYKLTDVYTKKVNNIGDGDEDLYGVRNFRVILHGIAYRGGANNYYHKTNKRDNRNPLPNDGLQNLCEEGFSKAVYLYSTNFSTAPKQTNCRDLFSKNNQLNYVQWSPYNAADVKKVFTEIKSVLDDARKGPIYLHCWNGWHASGLISSLVLRQFCGISGEKAVQYWDKNTDGNNKDSAYEKIRQSIRDFKPMEEFKVSPEVQKVICPII